MYVVGSARWWLRNAIIYSLFSLDGSAVRRARASVNRSGERVFAKNSFARAAGDVKTIDRKIFSDRIKCLTSSAWLRKPTRPVLEIFVVLQ